MDKLDESEKGEENACILEQYDAQIFAFIRSYLTKPTSHYLIQYCSRLATYYITIPVSKEETSIQKMLKLLFDLIKDLKCIVIT